jgi:hypothetical protein
MPSLAERYGVFLSTEAILCGSETDLMFFAIQRTTVSHFIRFGHLCASRVLAAEDEPVGSARPHGGRASSSHR